MVKLTIIRSESRSESGQFQLWDYVDANGENEIEEWTAKLGKVERTKLNVRLDLLQKNGKDLLPNILAGPIIDHVYKLRVHGSVQLRPLLCLGPIENDKEFTLLVGATERGSKLKPVGVEKKAIERRQTIINEPKRRVKHVRVT
jgi:hypothetical protein